MPVRLRTAMFGSGHRVHGRNESSAGLAPRFIGFAERCTLADGMHVAANGESSFSNTTPGRDLGLRSNGFGPRP
jgi:hypothetical protein